MNDIYGRVIFVFLAVVVMFLSPIKLYMIRKDNLIQSYVQTEVVYLTNNIKNTGVLTKEEYIIFLTKLSKTGKLFDVNIEKETITKAFEKIKIDESFTKHLFEINDFIRIRVKEKDTKNPIMAYFGGSIRGVYEK